MNYALYMDRIISHFTSGIYADEVKKARLEFFGDSVPFDEAGSDFEMRMNQFLEWYIFCRPLTCGPKRTSSTKNPPVISLLEDDEFELKPTEHFFYERLASTQHSLFEFIDQRPGRIYIRDFFWERNIDVSDAILSHGFSCNQVFEARLIFDQSVGKDGAYYFTRSFCFHPEEATPFILKGVERFRKERNYAGFSRWISELIHRKYKYEQYRHLKIEDVYSFERKLKF